MNISGFFQYKTVKVVLNKSNHNAYVLPFSYGNELCHAHKCK